jgi:NifU-like protein involved in Fe-S cluster formation
MEHFQSPSNRGAMDSPHMVGQSSLDGRAPFIKVYIRTHKESVIEARFEASGCGVTIAACSMMTELMVGKRLPECLIQVTPQALVEKLGIPSDKFYCAELAVRAMRDGIKQSRPQLFP